jgi:hypothetical protein
MSAPSRLPPGAAGALAWARKSVYGPGYRLARAAAFRRPGGMCQFCGLYPAEEAHHWGWRSPADADVTADALTALCSPCHWIATYRRVTARTKSGLWFVLAVGRAARRERKCAVRFRPRTCHGPSRPTPPPAAPWGREPDIRTLVERCHLVLVVGCLACERYVRLDDVPFLPSSWRSLPVPRLGRRFPCCRCRSHSRWVLLGGWPRTGTDAARRDRSPRSSRPNGGPR